MKNKSATTEEQAKDIIDNATVLFEGVKMPLKEAMDKLWYLVIVYNVSYSIHSENNTVKIEILEL